MTYATPLRAGDLNRQITIEQRTTTKDGFGQQSVAWTTFCTTRAYIEQMSGAEEVAGGAQVAHVLHQIVIRYRPGIKASMRVRYQGRIFDVMSVLDEFTKHRKLVLLCTEGLTRG